MNTMSRTFRGAIGRRPVRGAIGRPVPTTAWAAPRRRYTVAVSAALSAVALPLSLLVATPAAAEATWPLRPGALQRWAPGNMAWDAEKVMTQSIAESVARSYDVVMGTRTTFRGYVPAMRTANPSLRLFVYLNGVYAQSNEGSKYPESWYAHDAEGKRVKSRSFGNFMMDMSNPQWWAERASTCKALLAETGYDDCYLDMLGTAPLAPNYNTSKPIDPRTGKVWTTAALLAADLELARTVRAADPDGLLASNGLVHGQRYFKPAGQSPVVLFEQLDAVHAEIFLRDKNTPLGTFKSESAWKQDVDMLVDVGNRGKVAWTTTKLWNVSGSATTAQIDRWHKYALASFLLGSNGRSYFNFSVKNTVGEVLADHPWDRLPVGDALGAYAKANGVYRREFTNGMALVNPTTASVTVALGATYRTVGGASIASLTLGPNQGEVLLKQ